MRRQRSHPLARLLSLAGGVLLIGLIGLAALELVAGWALKAIREKRPAYIADYSDETYRKLYDTDAPDHYRRILAESWREADTVYSPFVEYRMVPHQGKAFSITEDGYRVNGAEPQSLGQPGPKVFVFGGSTTLGLGVADDETIPAAIERALAAAGRDDVKVFNFGALSYYSTPERIALERLLTAGTKPEVAVFIDGAEDFYSCTVPDQSAWNERLAQVTRARSRMPLLVELAHRSHVVQLARHLAGDKSVAVRESGRFCEGDGEIDGVIRRLDTNRRIIDATAERLGFKALFVQQPVPTYAYDNRKRPFPIKEEMLGYHMNAARGYPRMAQLRADGKLWEHGLLWLAEAEPAEGNAYIDIIHYSPRFNRVIGDKIAATLLDGALLPPR